METDVKNNWWQALCEKKNGLIGVLSMAALCGCGLTSCKVSSDVCTEVTLSSLKLCLPQEYFGIPFVANFHPATVILDIPASVLPIIPDDRKYGPVLVELDEMFESFDKRKAHAFLSYQTTFQQNIQESGMNVFTLPPKEIELLGTDILIPANGDKVFFICARKWIDRSGATRETLCSVHVDWDPKLTNPRVELEFHMQRKNIAHWKETEVLVRAFLKKYTVNAAL